MLCRVVKKNELKTNLKSLKNKNEQDIGSGYSSLANSPCRDETSQFQSFKPSSTENDSSSIWISPDFILDSSKVPNPISTNTILYTQQWFDFFFFFVIFKCRIILRFRRLLPNIFPTTIFRSPRQTTMWNFRRVLLILTWTMTLINRCKPVIGQIMKMTKPVLLITQTFFSYKPTRNVGSMLVLS